MEAHTWDDPTWDPSLNVARDPTDYYVIMWGETFRRWSAHHVPMDGTREDRELPVVFELLRCYHPKGAIWMTIDDGNSTDAEGLLSDSQTAHQIGRLVDVKTLVSPGVWNHLKSHGSNSQGSVLSPSRSVDPSNTHYPNPYKRPKVGRKLQANPRASSRYGNTARVGLDMGLEEWRDELVFRVQHLVMGLGGYKRFATNPARSGNLINNLPPFPAAL